MATKQQFRDFLSEIEPSDSTVRRCSTAHSTLRNKLASHPTFKEVHVETFLSGSYRRQTAIRPQMVDGELQRPDVDIIVQTTHTPADHPSFVISQLYDALRDCGYGDLRRNRRSVSVLLATVDMDVVPIIPKGDVYMIPDEELGEWLTTNPPGHTEWATHVNMETDGRFKPLVKMLKWWRRCHLADLRRPKGFILEALVADNMDRQEEVYEELFAKLMRRLKSKYRGHARNGTVPRLQDPAVPGNNVFSSVQPHEFQQFYETVCAHVDLIAEAQAEADSDKQLAKWRAVLGPGFPAAGGTRAANSELLQRPAPVAAAFPPNPVVPRKRGGFA